VEGDLKKQVNQSIKRLMDINRTVCKFMFISPLFLLPQFCLMSVIAPLAGYLKRALCRY